MEKCTFIEDIDQYSIDHIDEIDLKYHINTFDFPLLHTHADFWEFTILTEGAIQNIRNGKKEVYRENTLFFSTTHDAHCLKKTSSTNKLRYINIGVKETYLMKLLDVISPNFSQKLLNGPHSLPIPADTVYKIEELLYKTNLLKTKQLKTRNDLLSSALLLIVQHIFNSSISILDEHVSENFTWTQTLLNIMQNQNFPSYTVNDLCEKLGYSRMQLNRIFKTHFNKTPHEYLTDYKLRYAKSLLRSTDMKILDIAMSTGHSTVSQFQLNFKKHFGMTPGQYRKNSKSR